MPVTISAAEFRYVNDPAASLVIDRVKGEDVILRVTECFGNTVGVLLPESIVAQLIGFLSGVSQTERQTSLKTASMRKQEQRVQEYLEGEGVFRRIQSEICRLLEVSSEQLGGNSRKRPIPNARAVLAYLARKHTELSYPSMGELLAKNHATIILAERRFIANQDKLFFPIKISDRPLKFTMRQLAQKVEWNLELDNQI